MISTILLALLALALCLANGANPRLFRESMAQDSKQATTALSLTTTTIAPTAEMRIPPLVSDFMADLCECNRTELFLCLMNQQSVLRFRQKRQVPVNGTIEHVARFTYYVNGSSIWDRKPAAQLPTKGVVLNRVLSKFWRT